MNAIKPGNEASIYAYGIGVYTYTTIRRAPRKLKIQISDPWEWNSQIIDVMELREEAELDLGEFSPRSLAFLPTANCFLATDGVGRVKCLDLASGSELYATGEPMMP